MTNAHSVQFDGDGKSEENLLYSRFVSFNHFIDS
jgi:hypothetical protein